MATSQTRTALIQLGSFALAGVLLYLALRGVDFSSVGEALREANYLWLIPMGGLLLLSHWLRAWRWQVLLEALPQPLEEPRPVSVKLAFFSLMIGYMVNYAAPRLGEVARSANMARFEKLSLSGVIGTVVVERMLDVIVLALALVSVFFLLLDRTAVLNDLFFDPIQEQLGRTPTVAILSVLVGVSVFGFFAFKRMLGQEDSRMHNLWTTRMQPVLVSFKDGLSTLVRTSRRGVLVVSTVAMWFCYMLVAYLPFLMLDMATPYNLTLTDGWSIMVLGAIGVAIPSPGGTGSYHYITIQSLVYLFGVAQAPAATYAVATHAAQLILYVIVGFLCIVLQGSSLRTIRETTQQAQSAEG